jgi:hypothetical protein
MVTRVLMLGALLSTLIRPAYGSPVPAAVLTHAEASQEIAIQDLSVRDGAVSGTVVNKSAATLHDVELRIKQVWLWKNERHPGADSPGRTLPFTLRQDIAPHASASFAFQTPPLDQRSDGRFVTTVDVSSFTEVGL